MSEQFAHMVQEEIHFIPSDTKAQKSRAEGNLFPIPALPKQLKDRLKNRQQPPVKKQAGSRRYFAHFDGDDAAKGPEKITLDTRARHSRLMKRKGDQ